MPTIVVGADTPLGMDVIEALVPRDGEVRAFVSDGDAASRLRDLGIKVALGDVSDGSHVGGAALNTFCAVLVPDAAFDDRERSFALSPTDVFGGWADGLREAGTQRAIWLEDSRAGDDANLIAAAVDEFATVPTKGRSNAEIVGEVARLEGADQI